MILAEAVSKAHDAPTGLGALLVVAIIVGVVRGILADWRRRR